MTQVYDNQLVNWNGAPVVTRLVDGDPWVVKRGARREALGYLLARGLLNVPEVRLFECSDGKPRAMVRLAKTYSATDLPIRDLDEAVAAELAFSLWIRRRDTHAYNRAYVDGLPMFFDHGAAFDITQDLDDFFASGPDNGYVPAWRVEVWGSEPTTSGTRWLNDVTALAIHPIRNRAAFLEHFDAWVGRLSGWPPAGFDTALSAVGIRGRRFEALGGFLRRTQAELPHAARRARALLTRDAAIAS